MKVIRKRMSSIDNLMNECGGKGGGGGEVCDRRITSPLLYYYVFFSRGAPVDHVPPLTDTITGDLHNSDIQGTAGDS